MVTRGYIKRVRKIAMVGYIVSAVLLVLFFYSLPAFVIEYIRLDYKLMVMLIISEVALMVSNLLLDKALEAVEKGFI